MAQFSFTQTGQAALLASIAAAFPVVAYGAPAARVDFAVGNVTAVNAAGQARALSRGAQVEQGETIATNSGRAQLRFADGAYVSLQPQSEFRIDQYRFEGKQDGTERTFLSLVKGGLRTITGMVGRSNKKNYQITTSVATIGIRGTEYTIQYGNSISGTVGEGEIEVCNGAGCLNVTDGETYYVAGQDVKPVLSNKGTDLPPSPPENPPAHFADGENVDASGTPCAIGGACGNLLSGTGKFNTAFVTQSGSAKVLLKTITTVNSGQLASTGDGLYEFFAPYSEVGGDSLIAWGRAAKTTGGESTSYVAGIPVDIGTLGKLQATYTLLGATLPTGTFDGKVGGTLDKMSMTATFPTGDVTGAMNWTLESKSLSATFSGGLGGPIYPGGPTSFSGSVSLQGFFAGSNAERAGFVYSVNDSSLSQSYVGSAALTQTTSAPVR